MSDNQIKITITMPDIFWRALGAAAKTTNPVAHLPAAKATPRRKQRRIKNRNVQQMTNPATIAMYHEGISPADVAQRCHWSDSSVRDQVRGASVLRPETRAAIVSLVGEDGFDRIMARIKDGASV